MSSTKNVKNNSCSPTKVCNCYFTRKISLSVNIIMQEGTSFNTQNLKGVFYLNTNIKFTAQKGVDASNREIRNAIIAMLDKTDNLDLLKRFYLILLGAMMRENGLR